MSKASNVKRGADSQQRMVRRPRPIVETEIISEPPTISARGTLEMKRGKLCLRQGDRVLMLSSGKYKITRSWMPPGTQPWDTDLYAMTPNVFRKPKPTTEKVEA